MEKNKRNTTIFILWREKSNLLIEISDNLMKNTFKTWKKNLR